METASERLSKWVEKVIATASPREVRELMGKLQGNLVMVAQAKQEEVKHDLQTYLDGYQCQRRKAMR